MISAAADFTAVGTKSRGDGAGTVVRASGGGEGEMFFTNCRFGAESDEELDLTDPDAAVAGKSYCASAIRRMHGADARPWFFSNCVFVASRCSSALFVAEAGVNIFNDCTFIDRRTANISLLVQNCGRLEMHGCRVDSSKTMSFVNNPGDQNPILGAIEIVVEDCSFGNSSMALTPYAPIFLRGSGNRLGRINVSGLPDYPEFVASDLQLRTGRAVKLPGVPWKASWLADQAYESGNRCTTGSPALGASSWRVYECVRRGTSGTSGSEGPTGTGAWIQDGDSVLGPRWRYLGSAADCWYFHPDQEDRLVIGWNADWIEMEGGGAVRYIHPVQNSPEAYEDGRASYPLGTTLRLHASDSFKLLDHGNLDVSSEVTIPSGAIVSLRYSALARSWVRV